MLRTRTVPSVTEKAEKKKDGLGSVHAQPVLQYLVKITVIEKTIGRTSFAADALHRDFT